MLATLLMGVVPTACVDEVTDYGQHTDPHAPTTPSAETELLFRIAVPQNEEVMTPTTRAITEKEEQTVKQVDVLAFAQGGDGKYYFAYHAPGGEVTASSGGGSTLTFKMKARVLAASQKFSIIVNAREVVDGVVASMHNKVQSEALALLQKNLSSGRFPAVSSDNYQPIPMWGDSPAVVVDGESTLISTNAQPIKLLRMTARIDVLLDTTTVAARAKTSDVFRLKHVLVFNYNTRGHIVPHVANMNMDKMTATRATVPVGATPTEAPALGFAVPNPNAFTQSIYILETANSTAAPVDRTCLVIGGVYSKEGNFAGVDESYYRIDFIDTAADGTQPYADILRNHLYRFRITEVQGTGYAEPEEAFAHAPMNMKVDWFTWDQGEAENIAFDKDTYLSVSRTDYTFDANESYNGVGADATNVVDVYSNNADGWYIRSIKDAWNNDISWMQVYEATSPPVLIANNVPQQAKKSLYFHFGKNDTGLGRTAIITFAAGRLENKVTVTQTNKVAPMIQLFHVDEQGHVGNEIADGSIILFDADTDRKPKAQTLALRWSPGDGKVTVNVSYDDVRKPFVTAATNFTDGQTLSGGATGDTSHEEHFLFDPPAILATGDEKDIWHGREVTLTFSIGTRSRTVILRQVNYAATFSTGLPPADKDIYLMDGSNKAFFVRANFDWQVAISDGGGIIDKDNGLISSTTGGINTSLTPGGRVDFRFLDWLEQYRANAIPNKNILPATAKVKIYRTTDSGNAEYSTHSIKGTPLRVRPVGGFIPGTDAAVDSVPSLGGSSVAFEVEGKANYEWKAELALTAEKRTVYNDDYGKLHPLVINSINGELKIGDPFDLVNHRMYLTDEHGADIALTSLSSLTPPCFVTTDKPLKFETTAAHSFSKRFKVKYPMLYFPNREIPDITTTVRVYIVVNGQKIALPTDLSQVSVGQKILTRQSRERVWCPDGYSPALGKNRWIASGYDSYLAWGSMRSSFMHGVRVKLRKAFFNGEADGTPDKNNPIPNFTQDYTELKGGVNDYGYIHVGMGPMVDPAVPPSWSTIEYYWKKGTNSPDDDAVLWIQGDRSVKTTYITYMNAHMPPGYDLWETDAGLTVRDVQAFSEAEIRAKGTRLYDFLVGNYTDAGHTISNINSLGFYLLDDAHSELRSWPPTAVPILYSKDKQHVILLIDPTTNFLFMGESQLFPADDDDADDADTLALMNKFIQYIISTSAYGGSFSRMLVDTCPVPAPWDNDYWGRNRYPH